LADEVEGVFQNYFYRTATDMDGFEYAMQKEGLGDWERAGEPTADVIALTVGLDEDPANDLQEILEDRHSDWDMDVAGEETEFAADAHYARSRVSAAEVQKEWDAFEEGLKSRGRFFNQAAEARLSDLFGQIHALRTKHGCPVVRAIGPGTDIPSLHRARVFQSDAKLTEALAAPERLIGSPASQFAAAGRMNAKGVSVFYGATDTELTLAETRPPVGSRAVVGRFDLLTTLTVLDVEALEGVLETGSFFDPGFIRRLKRAKFFESLAGRIRMPVMPDDEGVDYLATQAMAEYLADRVSPRLDGVLYGSAQGHDGARNVALFNHAARVEDYAAPTGATYKVWLSSFDGDEEGPDYTVFEMAETAAAAKARVARDKTRHLILAEPMVTDDREPTLRLDRASLRVRHVQRIDVRAPAQDVSFLTTSSHEDSPF
jgi:hypothetical protein